MSVQGSPYLITQQEADAELASSDAPAADSPLPASLNKINFVS